MVLKIEIPHVSGLSVSQQHQTVEAIIIFFKIVEIDSNSLSQVFVDLSWKSSYLALCLGSTASITFNCGDAFYAHPLRAVHQVLQCLWTRMPEVHVPKQGITCLRSSFSPCVEVVPLCEEYCLIDFF